MSTPLLPHIAFPRTYALFLISIAIGVLVASAAPAGQLDDFERDASRRRSPNHASSSSTGHDDTVSDPTGDCLSEVVGDCLSDICANLFGELFKAMAAAGAISAGRIENDTSLPGPGLSPRRSGEALLPFLRLDLVRQDVEGDVTARDVRFEAGYGALGMEARRTVYREETPADDLEIQEFHGLYRMSVGNPFEIDLGMGIMALKGTSTTTGFSVTVPLLFHPSEYFGLEVRPVWSSLNENNIQDIEAAVLLGGRYASLKAGYRWMHSPHQSLDGPEIGLSLRW